MDQNVHHWGLRRRKNEGEHLFKELMTENIPNLGKETDMQMQEAPRVLNKMNSKQHILRHFRVFQENKNLKDFINSRSILQEILKVIPKPEEPG